MRDTLRLDYKAFTATTATAAPLRYGMSSVLVPVGGENRKQGQHDIQQPDPRLISIQPYPALPCPALPCPPHLCRPACRPDILSKEPPVHAVLRAFATERTVKLLVLMSLTLDPASGAMERGLAIYAPDKGLGAALVARLLAPEAEGAALGLVEAGPVQEDGDGGGGALWVLGQGNTQASRKQVEPVLRRLLEDPAFLSLPSEGSIK